MTRRFGISTLVLGLAAVGVLAGSPSSAAGQYFGRNKVQYESFDFQVLKTEHFDIYHYPEEDVAIEHLVLMAERWYARLSRLLNHDLSTRQPLIMYASAPHFRQTNTLQGDLGDEEWKREMPPLYSSVVDEVYALGGVLSGEHGIGWMKKAELSRVLPPAHLKLLQSIKRAVDPAGILNPGKVLPSPATCGDIHAVPEGAWI